MAADNRSVVITLKLEKNQSEQTNPTDTQATQNATSKDSTAKEVAKFAVVQVVQEVANEIVAWADYEWNRELMLNDDYVGQRNKNIAMTQINRAVSYGSTILSNTAAGAAVGGAPGAVIGFVIGTAKVTANVVRNNLQGQDQQNISLRQMEAQLQFTRSRAGWSLKAASIGEDL